MAIKLALITSCSSTRGAPPEVKVGELPKGLTMSQALDEWTKRLKERKPSITPRELYRGLGFHTLAKIQEEYKPSTVKIVTGGLGLTDINEMIVPYDFTASPKEAENIHQAVTAEPFVQTVWWKMINVARHKNASPVSELVQDTKYDYVIIACSKIFLRYISDDILNTPVQHRHKIRIILAASSQGSVPMQLRPMMVCYGRSFVGQIPGNRNDNNHRAALRFIEMMQDPEFVALPIDRQQAYIDTLYPIHEVSSHTGRPIQELEEFLRNNPELLKMDWPLAYRVAYKRLGTMGGRILFRGIHRRLSGAEAPEVSAKEISAAEQALTGMEFLSSPAKQGATEETEVLTALQAFVGALKRLAPNAVFTAADVCRWAPGYYKALGRTVPPHFESAIKLAFVLKNNAGLIGVQDSPGAKGFALIPSGGVEA